MCFSPEISFASGAVITAIGAATLNANPEPKHKMLASLPLLFGLQQFAEGFVWLQLASHVTARGSVAVMVFLGFALVIWPAYVPLACYRAETEFVRKKILLTLTGLGLGVGFSTFWLMATGGPEAYVVGHSVGYRFTNWIRILPANFEFFTYFLTAQVPFFISSKAWVRIIGALIFTGLILAMIVRHEAVTSVWCFFAAVVSCYIAFHIHRHKHSFDKKVSAF